jgi:predicted Rossmann-fold nucleotide-binding protein
MDELFEAVTLIQTKKIRNFPVVLMGKDYWAPLIDLLELMAAEKTIDTTDLDLLLLTDSVDEAMEHIRTHAIEAFGLRQRKVFRRSKILGEA